MTNQIDHTHPHAQNPEAIITGCILDNIEAEDGLDQDVLVERVMQHHPHVSAGQILADVACLIECDSVLRDDSNHVSMAPLDQDPSAIPWGAIDGGDGSS